MWSWRHPGWCGSRRECKLFHTYITYKEIIIYICIYIYISHIYILTDVFCNKITDLYILTNWYWYSKYTQITSLDLGELLSWLICFLKWVFLNTFSMWFSLQISYLFLPHSKCIKTRSLVLRKQLKLLSQVQNIDLKFAFRINTLDFCAGLDHCNPVNNLTIPLHKAPSESAFVRLRQNLLQQHATDLRRIVTQGDVAFTYNHLSTCHLLAGRDTFILSLPIVNVYATKLIISAS